MTRRSLFRAFLPQAVAPLQHFGPVNMPSCPVCHTSIPLDHPDLRKLVGNPDNSIGQLANVRECICGTCGNVWVVPV